jgi:hypothetical protein
VIAGAPSSRGVLVVGMHRSGTSATTRTLNLLGLPLCTATDLEQRRGGNATGHWESRTMMRFNEKLLSCLGSRWNRVPDVEEPIALWHRLAAHAEQARATFDSVHTSSSWVWKDPRNCILLPFWRTVLACDPPVVLVVRDPIEVVASLWARDRISPDVALTLWERSMRHALLGCAGAPTFAVHYRRLLEDSHAVCRSMASFLIEAGIPAHPADADVDAFLDPTQCHHTSSESKRTETLNPRQRTLVEVLNGLEGAYWAFDPPVGVYPALDQHPQRPIDDGQKWPDRDRLIHGL